LRKTQGTDQELLDNPELLSLLMPIIRADALITEMYVYEPENSLEIPITVFYGNKDKLLPNSNVLAWERHTSGAFSGYDFDGDHFFNSSQNFIRQLGQCIEMV
jgi:medium-chain acyl-[acyl-carrier-protein] hydrolase